MVLFFPILLIAQIHENDRNTEKQQAAQKSEFYRTLLLGTQQITPNQEDYDVKYYGLDLTPDPQTALLEGKTEIIVQVTGQNLDHIEFNFWDGMTINDIYLTASPGLPLEYTRSDDILSITLGSTFTQGEQIGITIEYSGYPQNSVYGSFGFGTHLGKDFIGTFNQPYGARAWWPCKDFPIDKADSIDIRVTVPNNLIVASNGVLRNQTNSGDLTTYWWHHGYPIATYLVSLAIYPYFVWSDIYLSDQGTQMPISFYTFTDTNNAEPSYLVPNYKKTRSMIEFFASIFGEYPFLDEKYGHAEWTLSFGMEHQTLTSMGNPTERRVAHELAHMWWGDMITCRTYHHIWLNEGFARYAESLWFAHSEFVASVSEYQLDYHSYKGAGTIYVEDPFTEDIFDIELSYNKASWVLHMLRHAVDDSVFFNILNAYHFSSDHQHSTATTEDFQLICEQVSGLNLDKFFQQWIYGEYFPSYSSAWLYEPVDGGYNLKVEIKQLQSNTDLFWMPIDVNVTTTNGSSVFVARDSLQTQSFQFFIEDRPLSIELDKDDWILKDATIHIKAPYIQQIMFDDPYQVPGSGNLQIFCETFNPDSHDIEISAMIESFDRSISDSILLYDDGSHGDGTADDGIFGGSWLVPQGELFYKMHMFTRSLDSSYINYQHEISNFASVGPVSLVAFSSADGDSVTSPGADFLIKLELQNYSGSVTIPNITAELVASDTCINQIIHDRVNYGILAPGESAMTEGVYALRINPKCPAPHKTNVDILIKSDGRLFWKDRLQFDIVSSVEKDPVLPLKYVLHQNYPNPFNPKTVISWQLAVGSYVELSVYNVLGEEVANLVAEQQKAGYHRIEWDASGFASGVYYYRLSAESKAHSVVKAKKLVLLR
jgi:hypothetical protein